MPRVARRLSRVLALGLAFITLPSAAQAQITASPETGQLLANDGLRPGQFRWHPEAAPEDGAISIVVSLPLQRVWVFRGNVLIGVSTASTGQPGYDTPEGRFTILQKKVDHRSNLYDDAPMPFMQRLTWDGIALHAGRITGEPESHGCIRLPRVFAQRLYGVTSLGTRVIVTYDAPGTPEEVLAHATQAIDLAIN
jgi:hypothetical protein